MTEEEARIGLMARVREDAWKDFCVRSQQMQNAESPPTQPITSLRSHGSYKGYAMLAYPFWWWRLEELEVA